MVPGEMPQPGDQSRGESVRLWVVLVPLGEQDVECDRAIGAEAGIDVRQSDEASYEQARTHETRPASAISATTSADRIRLVRPEEVPARPPSRKREASSLRAVWRLARCRRAGPCRSRSWP